MRKNLDIAISMTCYKRLDYLPMVFKALSTSLDCASQKHIKIYISIDYYDSSVSRYIATLNEFNKTVIVNKPSIGCNSNTEQVISLALRNHDAIIHLEDDIIPTRDAISFYTDALHLYQDDSKIISVSGYNRTVTLEPDKLKDTTSSSDFICWGCAFWKTKSAPILDNWTPFKQRDNSASSWDTYLNEYVFQKMNYYQVRPVISRIQNVGAKHGTYSSLVAQYENVNEEQWHKEHHMSPYTSDDINYAKNY